MNTRRNSFTSLEAMALIGIVLILIGLLYTALQRTREEARKKAAEAKAREEAAEAKAREEAAEAKATTDSIPGLVLEHKEKGIYRLPGMETKTDKYGNRMKAIARMHGVELYSTHACENPNGKKLDFFAHHYFVLDFYPEKGDIESYHLCTMPRRVTSIGWVKASDVQLWPTSIGSRYIRMPETDQMRTPPLLIYKTPEDAVNKQGPIAYARHTYNYTFMPWPIFQSKVVEVGEKKHEVVELAFLVELTVGSVLTDEPSHRPGGAVGGSPSPSPIPTERDLERVKSSKELVVVFVVDTTWSMQPHINAAREAVKTIVSGLKKADAGEGTTVDLSMAMVEYRDYEDKLGFAVKRHLTGKEMVFKDLQRFLDELSKVKEFSEPNREWEEAVFDGLYEAISKTEWGGESTTRAIVLIGDNSGHEPGHKRNPRNISLDRLISMAKENKIRIYSMVAPNRCKDTEELKRHERQFSELAENTGGGCFKLDNPKGVMDSVLKVLTDRVTLTKEKYEGFREVVVEGKTPEEVKRSMIERGVDVRHRVEIMEALGELKDQLKPNTPTFATGWVCIHSAGIKVLEKEVLIAKSELLYLIGEFAELARWLGVKEAFRAHRATVDAHTGERGVRVGEESFVKDEMYTGSMTIMRSFYRARGVPLSENESGLLKYTPQDLFRMTTEERNNLAARLMNAVPILSAYLKNIDRFKPEEEWGFILERDLP